MECVLSPPGVHSKGQPVRSARHPPVSSSESSSSMYSVDEPELLDRIMFPPPPPQRCELRFKGWIIMTLRSGRSSRWSKGQTKGRRSISNLAMYVTGEPSQDPLKRCFTASLLMRSLKADIFSCCLLSVRSLFSKMTKQYFLLLPMVSTIIFMCSCRNVSVFVYTFVVEVVYPVLFFVEKEYIFLSHSMSYQIFYVSQRLLISSQLWCATGF